MIIAFGTKKKLNILCFKNKSLLRDFNVLYIFKFTASMFGNFFLNT